jgi:hypothetical protein
MAGERMSAEAYQGFVGSYLGDFVHGSAYLGQYNDVLRAAGFTATLAHPDRSRLITETISKMARFQRYGRLASEKRESFEEDLEGAVARIADRTPLSENTARSLMQRMAEIVNVMTGEIHAQIERYQPIPRPEGQ